METEPFDWSILNGARIKFWVCPDNHPRVRWGLWLPTPLDLLEAAALEVDDG